MANIEEEFLSRSMNGALSLRVSLSNGDRVRAKVSEFSKYDVNLDTDTGPMSLSKKDVTSLSFSQPIVEQEEPAPEPAAAPRQSRSRMQDEFLDKYIREKTLALLKMVNGDSVRGVIIGYDGFTMLVRTGKGQVLAYKHGLIGISPGYRRD